MSTTENIVSTPVDIKSTIVDICITFNTIYASCVGNSMYICSRLSVYSAKRYTLEMIGLRQHPWIGAPVNRRAENR